MIKFQTNLTSSNSCCCVAGLEKTRDALKEWFAIQLATLANDKGLNFGGWEDGLMEGELPYNR